MVLLLWSLTLVILVMAASERRADPTCSEPEIDLVLRARGVRTRRKVEVLSDACTFIASQKEPDREYVANESQESTESQLEAEMQDDSRTATPLAQSSEEPDSLERLRAPPGAFGSPVPFALPDGSPRATSVLSRCAGAASSSAATAPRAANRPPRFPS